MFIENGGQFLSQSTGKGDIALVIELPKGNGHSLLNSDLMHFLKDQSLWDRLSGVFIVYPNHLPTDKKNPPLKALRQGWERVKLEIDVYAPQTKRILLMCDTNLLRAAMPALGKVADIGATHGT